MTFRRGDNVSVTGVVTQNHYQDEKVQIQLESHHSRIRVEAAVVTMVQPRFDLGDAVEFTDDDGGLHGTIIAIQNGHAWVDLGDEKYRTFPLSSIVRVEQSLQRRVHRTARGQREARKQEGES
jgi:preprotein translocase subunit YajC